ncbi:MAG: SDR family oxidoreductase [Candidatus Parcubacteria bacterium]|nr:SDR family oxidoreductase [Candidatus Parcubacteria bacterium]
MNIILLTGGTSGIGKETVKGLAITDATVVFTARDREKGEEVKREIIKETNNNNVDYLVCDLASLSSVRACAREFAERWDRLDILINNAGVLPQERQESRDGIELNFAVNFLAPFLLTNLLLPLLKQSAPARIINVSSSMHAEGNINFDDLESKKAFDKYKAYAQSKLALLLFTKKLAKELQGTGVTVNALHPGVIGTEMTMRNVRTMNPIAAFFFKRTLITPAQGAKTSVYLATSPDVAGVTGEYFDKKKIAAASPLADDTALADKLWDISAKLVGL